jgi:hypothetical protein
MVYLKGIFYRHCSFVYTLTTYPACASYNGDLESYVDDTKTLLSFPLTEADTGIKNLEEDLHKIASWCCENNPLVNPD